MKKLFAADDKIVKGWEENKRVGRGNFTLSAEVLKFLKDIFWEHKRATSMVMTAIITSPPPPAELNYQE